MPAAHGGVRHRPLSAQPHVRSTCTSPASTSLAHTRTAHRRASLTSHRIETGRTGARADDHRTTATNGYCETVNGHSEANANISRVNISRVNTSRANISRVNTTRANTGRTSPLRAAPLRSANGRTNASRTAASRASAGFPRGGSRRSPCTPRLTLRDGPARVGTPAILEFALDVPEGHLWARQPESPSARLMLIASSRTAGRIVPPARSYQAGRAPQQPATFVFTAHEPGEHRLRFTVYDRGYGVVLQELDATMNIEPPSVAEPSATSHPSRFCRNPPPARNSDTSDPLVDVSSRYCAPES
ncbi:hypothetical protein [Streptomyces zagrosensis]|uniref:Uncharacterized protein n=1 Tax=Streptomyces zagrosensis TaxID=1042984 RepID=A0A7W9UYJ1_9ACTN|nr:hypothetical protein [Streptomyces zagrosensis]MBB5935732.1 hypothetical protein [Streptomyces zagrosensis]